jgi:hypothetical protein
LRRQLQHSALAGGEEVALQVEVLGRVAGDAELGEDHQLGALVAGTALAALLGAASFGIALGVGQVCFAATLVWVLLR